MNEEFIPATFVQYAADILADTNKGLKGSTIIRATGVYAVEYHVNLPHLLDADLKVLGDLVEEKRRGKELLKDF